MDSVIEVIRQPARIIEIVQPPSRVVEVAMPGPRGPRGLPGSGGGGSPGSNMTRSYVAAQALGGHRALVLTANGELDYASNNNPLHALRLIGISTEAVGATAPTTAQTSGEIVEPSWSWAPNLPIYLGVNGLLTQTPPTAPSAKFLVVMGFPAGVDSMYVQIGTPINLI